MQAVYLGADSRKPGQGAGNLETERESIKGCSAELIQDGLGLSPAGDLPRSLLRALGWDAGGGHSTVHKSTVKSGGTRRHEATAGTQRIFGTSGFRRLDSCV